MESTICMNDSCGATVAHDWKKGWPLRSGGFAHLCFNCGSAFENSVFCDKFHLEETGWRECHFCKKRIHCGCITSKTLFEHLDYGGIGCINCLKVTQLHLFQNAETPTRFGMQTKNHVSESETTVEGKSLFMDNSEEERLMQLCRVMEANESNLQLRTQRNEIDAFSRKIDHKVICPFGKMGTGLSNVIEPPFQPLAHAKLEESNGGPLLENKDMLELSAKPSLCMLGNATGNSLLPFTSGVVEGRELGKVSSFSQAQRVGTIMPKPLKTSLPMNSETNKTSNSQLRIARPPADGRGKNQLLPRYWPRITDQELEQLSGNLNSTVIPLFEKQLSASDAGRIGRLVLPKACAEAYFPPINQSDGIPLKMQDAKGNEWTFQFRFWPNNNSRMYVLEGVTPCIQSMKLKAGDTVTFSRIDPGGKLVIGFRKSASSVDTQVSFHDASASAVSNGLSSSGTIFGENEYNLSGNDADLLPEIKGSKVPDFSRQSENNYAANGNVGPSGSDNHGDMNSNGLIKQPIAVSEKRRTRNIGQKSKRLLIHSEDAQELKLTWDEALDLLRPPPSAKPSFVTIEDHVFEEYDEPPVFGKRTIFTSRPSGERDQWSQCNDCSKWRRLPVDILLPLKWTCSDNAWDTCRSTCSIPEEQTPKELDIFRRTTVDSKKRRTLETNRYIQENEPTGLDSLASAAVMGENVGDIGDPSAGATTKHPRHRPGCTCIVCIQPPSGKGKHNPCCTCNVCLTVKRRFKTLMLRKKKCQSERDAEAAQKENSHQEDDRKANTCVDDASLLTLDSKKEGILNGIQQPDAGEASPGELDLNYHPNREKNQSEMIHLLKMMSRIETYSHQVEDNKQPNGSTSYLSNQEGSAEPSLLPQSTAGVGTEDVYDKYLFSHVWERSIQFRQKK